MAFSIAMVAALPHIIASPGYGAVPWGDFGRWLHETERFARGEVLYRDFTWPFPPLAIWIVGGWMRVFGSGLASVHVLTSLILSAILGCYAYLLSRAIPERLLVVVTASSVVLALALAQRESASLALGMYTPAAPIGVLLLMLSLIAAMARGNAGARWQPLVLGLLCGMMVLTKHDVWVPAAALVIYNRSLTTYVAAMATVAAGAAIVALTAGASVLPGVLTGFNHAQEFGGRSLPDLESLTIALIATALAGAVLAVVTEAPRRWIWAMVSAAVVMTGLYTAASLASGADLAGSALELARGLSTEVPPLLLPVVVAVVLVHRRREKRDFALLLSLILLILATRARRGFQFSEWYHALLELPVYAMVALALSPGPVTVRRLQWVFVFLFLAGCAAEWSLGRVPLVGIGRLPAVETARGTVHWRPFEASRMQWLSAELHARDAERRRPLLAFRYTGGYSYFLDRRNPTGMPQGFRLSRFDPDSVVTAMIAHDPPIFALDTHQRDSATVPAPGLFLTSWKRPVQINHYTRHDRPYFERILAHCEAVAWYPDRSRPVLILHSCGNRASLPGHD